MVDAVVRSIYRITANHNFRSRYRTPLLAKLFLVSHYANVLQRRSMAGAIF